MILCCGLVTVDVLQTVEAVPGPDQKVVATDAVVDFGGPAANAAATAAALGSRVGLVAAVGEGALARIANVGLTRAGVEVIDVMPQGTPALSTVLVTAGTGERAVVSTNATGTPTDAAGAAERIGARLGTEDVLLVDGHLATVALPLARAARARGATVVMDAGSWKPGTRELVAACDVVVASAAFELPDQGPGPSPTEEILQVMASWGPRTVARSAGAGAIQAIVDGCAAEVDVPHIQHVVDTLGAGDVLHGALAAALGRGEADVEALRSAAAVASESVRYPGARGWVSHIVDR